MQHNYEDIVVGAAARIYVSIKNDVGLAADPGALRLKTKSPSGVLTTFTYNVGVVIVKSAVGEYYANVPMTAAGKWAYRWESDAPNAGADEGWISVKKSVVI
jgi:hypothetical protein